MEKIVCNLCGTDKTTSVYNDKELSVVMCQDCSLLYLNPRPTAEENNRFYEEDYQSKRHYIYDLDQATVRLSQKQSYQSKKRQLDFFRDYLKRDSRVLEIGAGWGTLLKRIQDEVRCEVSGIEMSKMATYVAEEYYSLNIFNGSFEQYLASNKSQFFDMIVAHHVVEHFMDPKAMLTAMAGLLKDNGYIYMAMPNIARPDEPLDRYFRIVHTYYFSPLTISRMLKEVGLKIIKFDTGINEMRMIVVKDNNNLPAIDTNSWVKDYSITNILAVISQQARKYRFLRFLKRLTEKALPQQAADKFKKAIIKLLRKLGIIKI